jgi:LacI family transcriptional regulator
VTDGRAPDADATSMRTARRRSARVVDVAALARVSVATVSRAFSKPNMVREEVRNRVLEAAKDLGYSPNAAARALRLMRSHVVGVLVPTLNHAIFAEFTDSIENAMAKAGYLVLIATTGFDRHSIPAKARQVLERGAEAIVCVGRVEDVSLRELLRDRNVPLVTTWTSGASGLFPSIGFDNAKAARTVAEHLRDLGHRRIAVLIGPLKGNDRQEQRIVGYYTGFEADANHKIEAMIECSYSLEEGGRALESIQRKWPGVTAIACASDILALGVLARCDQLGISVPDDLSVVGFDDMEIVKLARPPLTTLHVPADEMGRLCAQAILARLDGSVPLESVQLETRLVQRSSTASPPPRSVEKLFPDDLGDRTGNRTLASRRT